MIPAGEFAGGVHQQEVGFVGGAGLGAPGDLETGLLELGGHSIPAFLVARDEDQKKAGMFFPELFPGLGQKQFLAVESAARDDGGSAFGDAERFKHGPKIANGSWRGGGIVEFDASGDLQFGGFDAQRNPALAIGGFLQAERVDLVEDRCLDSFLSRVSSSSRQILGCSSTAGNERPRGMAISSPMGAPSWSHWHTT